MNANIKALAFITDSMSPHVQRSDMDVLRKDVLAGAIDWESVVVMANENLLVPALWAALQDKGLIDLLPGDLTQYLRELHTLNRERNKGLKDQLEGVIQALGDAGIQPVLLKGAAHLYRDCFDDPGARIMTDLDVLVKPQVLEAAVGALKNKGYREDEEFSKEYPDHHHWAPLFRPGDYGAVELHRSVMESETADVFSEAEAWENIELVEDGGAGFGVLNPGFRVLHNIAHSELSDRAYEREMLDLRAIYETVQICRVYGDSVDWSKICAALPKSRYRRAFTAHVYCAHRLFGMPLPHPIKAGLLSAIHYYRGISQIRWNWYATAEKWADLFSARSIRRSYGCEDALMPITKCRFKRASMMIRSRFSRKAEELRDAG